jgi:folylpolyglutamate synthase/dihydropteroate synthase
MTVAQFLGIAAVTVDSVGEALRLAAEQSQGGAVVVSGSVYLVGDARPLLLAAVGDRR